MFGDVRFVCMGGTPQVNLIKLNGKDSFKRTVHKFGLCAKVNQISELCFYGEEGKYLKETLCHTNRQAKPTERSDIQENISTIYMNDESYSEEKIFQEPGPEFILLGPINIEKVKVDLLTGFTKIRFSLMGKTTKEIDRYKDLE